MRQHNLPKKKYFTESLQEAIAEFPSMIDYLDFSKISIDVVKTGKIEILFYIHSKEITFTEECAIVAASHGFLEILKFLIEQEYPYTIDIFMSAANNRNYDIVTYLLDDKKMKNFV